jgi:hypothetical protein
MAKFFLAVIAVALALLSARLFMRLSPCSPPRLRHDSARWAVSYSST